MMKFSLYGIMIASILLIACNQQQEEVEVDNKEVVEEIIQESGLDNLQIETAHLLLQPALFKIKLDNDSNVVLLDIRTPEELAENGTMEGAINLDYYADDFKSKIEAMDREVPVMLYCRSGGRSGEAASLLEELGFKQVYDLNGGYNAWLEAGY